MSEPQFGRDLELSLDQIDGIIGGVLPRGAAERREACGCCNPSIEGAIVREPRLFETRRVKMEARERP